MALTVTPARRRIAMGMLLVLAAAGGVVRELAPDPSVLRDVGTLMLVLWLPAVGNLIGYLKGKIPQAAPPPTHFAPGLAFSPQLEVQLQRLPLPPGLVPALDDELLGTVLVGRRGFSVRFEMPLRAWLQGTGDGRSMLELLRPASAGSHLVAGTAFHLLAGTQVVAKGVVVRRTD
ncbi:MAG: hypothetical protein HY854_13985 [Burkholderiales bacterium]|nr:hypothetical protein [Burkholderiales bacterium]